MAKPPKFCRDGDTIYGYDPVDVVRVGQEGRAGVKGTPGDNVSLQALGWTVQHN